MNIAEAILNKVQKSGRVSVADMVKKTGLTRSYLNRFFKELCDEGKIVLIGKANRSHYVPATSEAVSQAQKSVLKIHFSLKNENLEEHVILERVRSSSAILLDLPENILKIFNYAFTEMLNNAIEHSLSATIEIKVERLPQSLHFTVGDKGIGILKNIMEKKGLASPIEAIGELLKGKLTTAPQAHSGEGIFFTSKVADRLVIKSGQKKLTFDNLLDDIAIVDCPLVKGTKVMFAISCLSQRRIDEVFRRFSNDAFEFDKTHIYIRLYQVGKDFVSRSQARRILSGLDAFETVTLDFLGLSGIGQAFADEIFRVWKNNFPQKKILVKNSNENIDFMIQRAGG